MKTYKACVKDRKTNESLIISITQSSKQAAIKDMRANGYSVDSSKVKEAELFDWILQNTNADSWDWKLNKIPN